MIFCGEEIKEGQKRTISIPVPAAPAIDGVCFCGKRKGKTLVITAGVHGCEYVGVQAVKSIIEEINPLEMSGNLILLPLVNRDGFYGGAKGIVPEDGINLNRAFPGKEDGSLSFRIAYALERALYPAADFLADLHSGDCNEALRPLVFFPVAGGEEVNRLSKEAAETLTVPYRVRSTAKNGLYSYAVQCGIPSLLIERGGQGLWSWEEVKACKADIYALLGHLEILGEGKKNQEQKEIAETDYVQASLDGLWYPQVTIDQMVCKGQLLGRLESLRGEVLGEVRAKFNGVVLYHTTALGVKAQEALIAYGHT